MQGHNLQITIKEIQLKMMCSSNDIILSLLLILSLNLINDKVQSS